MPVYPSASLGRRTIRGWCSWLTQESLNLLSVVRSHDPELEVTYVSKGYATDQTKIDGRDGAWLQSCTGRQIHIMDPRAEDFGPKHTRELAEQLAKNQRYGGATAGTFYGNAEHSVLVSVWAEELAFRDGVHPELVELVAKHGLFHDASDAYLPDIPRPVKHGKILVDGRWESFAKRWKPIEDRLMRCILSAYQIFPTDLSTEYVKRADREVLFRETEELMHTPSLSRDMLNDYNVAEVAPIPLDWAAARDLFFDRYTRLFGLLP